MFEIKENEVYYKNGDMIDWILYGQLYVPFITEKTNWYEIKKFNIETEQYEHTNDMTYFNGYTVEDGFFYVEPVPIPIPEPKNSDISEQNLIIMEAMAAQYEEQQEKDLNNAEVQATIYEAILELGGAI